MALPTTPEAWKMAADHIGDNAIRFTDMLRPSKPVDVIALDMPWGDMRRFSVPAANERNPKFQFFPKRKQSASAEQVITVDMIRTVYSFNG